MRIHTASEGVSLAKSLESEVASFYDYVAQSHVQVSQVFVVLAAENRRTIEQIDRTYYGVISDAIEGGFCFDLDPEIFAVKLPKRSVVTAGDAISVALDAEQTLSELYTVMAGQSEQLMADLTRLFSRIAVMHGKRVARLHLSFEDPSV